MQKYIPKSKLKKQTGLLFTNFLLICEDNIQDIIPDIKYQIEKYDIKLRNLIHLILQSSKNRNILILSQEIHLKEQTELLKDKLKVVIKKDVELAFVVSNIKDREILKEKEDVQVACNLVEF